MLSQIEIAVADDHPLMLRGIVDYLEQRQGFRIVGQAADATAAMALVQEKSPDILVLDLSMPGDVVGTIRRIATEYTTTRMVVITAFSSIDSAVKALDAGAMGFVLKGSPATDLIDAIEAASEGRIYIAGQYAADVLLGLRKRERDREVNATLRLNIRERQIVGELMHARTNREIAKKLNLSEKTIKHYMSNLMTKLNARNRVEVVLAAQQSLNG